MFKYKNTKEIVKIGDSVELSAAAQVKFGYNRGIVVGLQGFVTVKLANGDKVDFDMRSLSLGTKVKTKFSMEKDQVDYLITNIESIEGGTTVINMSTGYADIWADSLRAEFETSTLIAPTALENTRS